MPLPSVIHHPVTAVRSYTVAVLIIIRGERRIFSSTTRPRGYPFYRPAPPLCTLHSALLLFCLSVGLGSARWYSSSIVTTLPTTTSQHCEGRTKRRRRGGEEGKQESRQESCQESGAHPPVRC